MKTFNLISWDFKRNSDFFKLAILNGYEYWSSILDGAGIKSYVILITCNRVELYFRSENMPDIPVDGYIRRTENDAIGHLLRVASGLDSMSVGENEIMRQIKEAYEYSMKSHKTDKLISFLFMKAINTGKLVRSKTAISRGKTSITAIAADIARDRMKGKNILIIGTGFMGSELIKYIREFRDVSITVAGRDIDHARKIADQYGTGYSDLSDISKVISKNDIIMTAVSVNEPIINKNNAAAGKIFIDVGNPPNVDRNVTEKGSEIYSLDEIMEISRKNNEEKILDVKNAEAIIEEEEKIISLKLKDMLVDDIFSEFYRFAESVQKREIERYISENGGNYDSLYAMTHSVVNKIMNIPVTTLKSVVREQDPDTFSSVFKDFYDKFEIVIRSAFESYEDPRDTQSLRLRTRQLLRKP